MKYVFIDGNNLAIRAAFANDYMTNSDGEDSGAHYGFFNSLINLKFKFPDYQFLVAWDSGSARRKKETVSAKEAGIIKDTYKANRKRGKIAKPLASWFRTGHHLKNALSKTGIPQILMEGHEADDVIASYCEMLKGESESIVVVTSDHDYYQILDSNVVIWDGMKSDYVTKDSFENENGISPKQHVDVGALMGDTGDNIFGIPGWGIKTAIPAIKKNKTWENVIADLEKKLLKYESEYSELSDEEFDELSKKETKSGKPLYADIYRNQPHIGLLKGFDNKKIKVAKKDLMALLFKDRVKLAYSLKKMDLDIEGLPEIVSLEKDKGMLLEYFQYYDIVSLVDRVDLLFNPTEGI